MTEKMLASAGLVAVMLMDVAGMILLSCLEHPVPEILPDILKIVIGGIIVIAGVNGTKAAINGIKKTNGS